MMFLLVDTRYPTPSLQEYHSVRTSNPLQASSTSATAVSSRLSLPNSVPENSSSSSFQSYHPSQTPSPTSLIFDVEANFSSYIEFMVFPGLSFALFLSLSLPFQQSQSLIKHQTIIEHHPSVQQFQGLLLPTSSEMTKLINMKLVQKNEIYDLLKARYLCQKHFSSFHNIFCDGVIKVANYLKCNPKKDPDRTSIIVMYAVESQLIGSYFENESEFNSSILKFSRCIEKVCPMYHIKIHLICVKMIISTSASESNLIRAIRVLLNPFKEHIFIDTMDNLQLHYEYHFKELIRSNTQTRCGEIELPSIDDTRATLLIELTGTTLPASDLLRTIHLQQDRIQFTLLCTLPRSGLYPICILGNPLLVTAARNPQSASPR
jgi:hypothetical protein